MHTSSVKNQRFLTASPQGEAFGAVTQQHDKREFGVIVNNNRHKIPYFYKFDTLQAVYDIV